MKDDRAKCGVRGCSRKVGTKCQYCWQLVCGEHSWGVGVERVCHRCLEDMKKASFQ